MTHTSTEQEMAEFEAWWRAEMNIEQMGLARTEYPMTPPEKQMYKCHETERAWLTWQAARRAPVVPQGWRLVPEEWTEEMKDVLDSTGSYQKMLAAAPKQPEAAPVQMPAPAFYADDRGHEVSAEWLASDEATSGHRAIYIDPRYTEHQVRELLARARKDGANG